MQQQPTRKLLRLPDVMRLTGMSRSWLYKAVLQGAFPRFHKIGRASVWSASDVDAWISARLGADNQRTGEA